MHLIGICVFGRIGRVQGKSTPPTEQGRRVRHGSKFEKFVFGTQGELNTEVGTQSAHGLASERCHHTERSVARQTGRSCSTDALVDGHG